MITLHRAPIAVEAGPAAATGDTTVDILSGSEALAAVLRFAENGSAPRPGNTFQQASHLRAAAGIAGEHTAVVRIRRQARVVTVWPLRLFGRHGVRLATDLTFPFAQYSDVLGTALDRPTLEAAAARLRAEFGVDAVLCRGVRADSGLAEALDGTSVVEHSAAPYIDLTACGSFEQYCTGFSSQTMRNRRQRRRKLEAQYGPLQFAVLDGAQGRDAVALALQWKRDWLTANGLSSQFIDVGASSQVLLQAVDDATAHVSVLSAESRPIAIELGFSCGNHYAAYLGAFDPEFAEFSPGQEQMLLTVAWCFSRGFARYDLLPPRDAYKLRWTRGAEESVRDHCVPLSVRGALYALARRHGRAPAKRAVLSVPAGMRAAARRYGPLAAGIGATAATIGLLAE